MIGLSTFDWTTFRLSTGKYKGITHALVSQSFVQRRLGITWQAPYCRVFYVCVNTRYGQKKQGSTEWHGIHRFYIWCGHGKYTVLNLLSDQNSFHFSMGNPIRGGHSEAFVLCVIWIVSRVSPYLNCPSCETSSELSCVWYLIRIVPRISPHLNCPSYLTSSELSL